MCSVGSVHVTTCPFNGQVHASQHIIGIWGPGALGGGAREDFDTGRFLGKIAPWAQKKIEKFEFFSFFDVFQLRDGF